MAKQLILAEALSLENLPTGRTLMELLARAEHQLPQATRQSHYLEFQQVPRFLLFSHRLMTSNQ